MTQSVISAYESGKRQPSVPMLARLVSATGRELHVRAEEGSHSLARMSGPIGTRVRGLRTEVRKRALAHGMTGVRVFGSVARGEETEQSDLDLLVDTGASVGLFAMFRLQDELEALLSVPVDLVPAEGLKPDVREALERDLVAL